MSPRNRCLALAVALAVLVAATGAWADPPLDKPHKADEIIIKFKADATQHEKDAILADINAVHIRHFNRIKSDLEKISGLSVGEAIGRYKNHPKVEYIEPNYILEAVETPNDPMFPDLWGMENTGQTGGTAGADISATMAWDVFTGSSNIVVGVIDTGVDYLHPDLAANIWTNPDEIPGNGIDDDNNGYVDDIHGWDFYNDDNDPMDDNGHGTHCSGTIGGVGNNGIGVAGVNWTVKIMALKFLSAGGSGSTADAVDAVEYATMMALRYPGTIRLTSNSWGGGGFSQALRDAIEDSGNAEMLFCAAAGNSSSNTDVSPHYPSSYDLDNIVAVAATDHNDNLASFSSYGATTVDLAAPGVNILSTLPGNAYGLASGTSMATPHTSGVCALVFGRFPAISALDAKSLVLNGVDPLDNLAGVVLTGGRLNAFWPIAEPDSIPPAPVDDLAATEAGSNWVDLGWTATGDDDYDGTASRYDMRYATFPIDELTWDSANLATGEPDPGPPGTAESMRVHGLDFDTTYYFGVKVLDEFGNPSDISNLASATTLGVPDIASSPTSMSEALLTGGTSMQTLTLSNVGFGTLDYEIPLPTLLGGPVVVHEYMEIGKGWSDPRPSDPAIEDSGGPDSYGYRWVDSNDPFGPAFDWVDISGVGTAALTTGDDVNVGPFPIGFDFPYYGGDYTEFRICSNGFLSLSSSSSAYSNQPLPNPGAPGHLIAPFWDDLVVGAGTVYYHYDGNRLIVQWDGVEHYGSGGPYTFQAILYPDGTMQYQYLAMGSPDNSATVGWQNGAGTDGHNIVFNASYVEANLAVEIRAVPQWVTVTPSSGTIYAPNSQALDVEFDAGGLLGGTYDGIIRILSNDPDEAEYDVPVQLVVTGAPDIAVEPLTYDFGSLFLGLVGETDIMVRNVGTDELTISNIAIGDPAFVADVTSFTLPPRGSQAVHVAFTPTAAQFYSTTMTVTSDDPDDPVVTVDLSGEGLEPPEFAVDPTSLTSDLLTGQTDMQTLTLSNSGGSDFVYNLSVDFVADVTVHDSPDLGKEDVDTRAGIPAIDGQGGPDNYGYRWIDSDEPGGPSFNWVDISATGTPAFTATGDDRNYGPFPIGFTFPFYGNDFTEFRVCSNGWVSFTNTTTDLSNDPLPASGAPENLLAAFWDDLVVDLGSSYNGNVYYEYDGTRLIIQYDGVRRYATSNQYWFEIILYPNGTIMYQYLTMTPGRLDEATIGIQNDLRDDGLTVVYNADYVHDGLAVRLAAFPEWLTVSPSSGTIPPGGSEMVSALFDASGLFGGRYEADIVIDSNDPAVPTLPVPVTLNVTGAPQIEVTPLAIDFGSQFIGYPVLRNMTIANIGTDDLLISSVAFDDPVFTSNLTPPVTLGPTQSLLIDVNFVPNSATTFTGTMTIGSNDATSPTVGVALTGIGLVPPVASASPTSLTSALFTGESETQTVTLSNSGGSDLEFTINAELTAEQVVIHDSPDLGKEDVDTRPGILGSGGPDTFGYSWIDSDEPGGPTFDWVDISATGTPTFTGYSDDGNRGPFPIGFTFPFYGNDFTEFRVVSNGWVSFTSTSTDYSNDPLPASGAPENLLAVFWDDLKIDPANGSQIYYEYDGSRLIIQYDNVPRLGSGGPYTFQVLLNPNGTIVYQYLSMQGTRLDEATIGIQNAARDDGLTVVYNADYVHDNLAVRLGTVPDWLSANPAQGVVPPGGSVPIMVTFDASGLFGGGYDGLLRILNNDPVNGLIEVSAHLDVTGVPVMAFDPEVMDFGTVYVGVTESHTLLVTNAGTDMLSVTDVSPTSSEFTVSPTAFDLDPLTSIEMTVDFLPTDSGDRSADLVFTSNVAGSPHSVPMSAYGNWPPIIAVDPTSIEAAAMPGGQKVKTLTICNEGGSDLVFEAAGAEQASSVQVYEELILPKQADEEGSQEAVDPRPGILGTGGPDLFGYTWTDSDEPGGPVFDWVDITGVGTPVPFPSYIIDGNVGPLPLGFDFPFYGNTFNELYACNNGWMSFTSTSTAYSNQPLPNSGSSVPENLLAPWWDDMVYDESDGNYAYYYNDGSRFIITYYVRRIASFTPPFYEFQVILYPNGNIVFQYNGLGTTLNSNTIGIQNATKDDGLTVVHNDASYAHENLAILFSSRPAWLNVEPESGTVPAGECMDLTVTLDASELEAGDYEGTIDITSNDPFNSPTSVPLLFHVGTVDAVATDTEPNTLSVTSNGKWMTAYVELPPEYDPMDVVIETVLLNGVVPAESSPFDNDGDFNDNGIPDLMFKFDRTAIEGVLPEGENVQVTITGEIRDTIYFVATDYIRVINPTMTSPNGGEILMAGAAHTITWTDPDGWDVTHADVFWTPDDVNWYEVATNVQGTSVTWNSPVTITTSARVRVFVYDDSGMMGFDSSDAPFTMTNSVTGVDNPSIPKVFGMAQNAPNPFNPKTVIRFDLPRDERVNLIIYDVKGRVVNTLVSEWKSAGSHEVTWTGIDNAGRRVSSGVYFYKIEAGSFRDTKSMLLVK